MAWVPPGENRLATARSSLLADDRRHGGGEQASARARMSSPCLGRPVEAGAGAGVGQVAAEAQALQPVEDLLGLRVGQQHRAVVADMHEVVRRRADSRPRRCACAASPSARRQKMMPGGDLGLGWWSVTAKVPSGRLSSTPGCALRYCARSMRKSVSVRSAIETPRRQVFEVDDRVLELEQLLAAVFQIVHLVAGLLLDEVLLAGGGDVEQHHAAAHALLEVDVLLQLHVGPEVDELDAVVGRADAVDAAEALDDAHRVPVDVVVDEPVAVLKVLALGMQSVAISRSSSPSPASSSGPLLRARARRR